MKLIKSLIKKFKKESPLNLNKNKWRELNPHNKTILGNIFPFELVKVGKYSYGVLNVESWGTEKEGLEIGNYVSIASGVTFLLGGNRYTNTITTYPFKVMYFNETTPEALSKGKIIVEDDVWIGMNAMILSGVKIGKGAVIGAGSVVSKDIPPYAIAVGNPCKVVKYRFSENIINKIRELKFDNIDESLKEKLYTEVTESNVDELVEAITKNQKNKKK